MRGFERVTDRCTRHALVGAVFWLALLLILSSVGSARAQEKSGTGTITLVGQTDLAGGAARNSDIWGWVHPYTNEEFAIIGEWRGGHVYIVDVSDPTNPALTSTIETINPNNGFDVKTWDRYLYLVDGDGSNNDGEIYDILDPANPVFVGNFLSAHNIFITDDGYMYNEVTGLTILSLKLDPTNPKIIWAGGN